MLLKGFTWESLFWPFQVCSKICQGTTLTKPQPQSACQDVPTRIGHNGLHNSNLLYPKALLRRPKYPACGYSGSMNPVMDRTQLEEW